MLLYTNPLSSNARKVVSLIGYLGLEVEQKVLDFAAGDMRSPDYLALNPNGMVPTLVDGDFVLWESNAILKYLAAVAKASGGRAIVPDEVKGQADVDRWLFWQSSHFGPAIGKLLFEHVLKPMFGRGDPDPAAVEAGTKDVAKRSAVLDAQLAGREFVCGQLSVADFALGIWAEYGTLSKVDFAPYVNITSWLDRLRSLEGWAGGPSM